MDDDPTPVVIMVDGKPTMLTQRQVAELLAYIHDALERNLKELEILTKLLYEAERGTNE